MTTEKGLPESTPAPVAGNEETATSEAVELPDLGRPSPQVSEGSGSTSESVTAFIERTVDEMSQPNAEIIQLLPSQQGTTARMVTIGATFLKASVSEPIAVRTDAARKETMAWDSK